MKLRYREAAWLVFLFLLAWLPRTLALDAYVSPDERKWLTRSANFTYALSQADFAQTFQREHPGVTVMWVGTLGLLSEYPGYAQEAPGYFTWERENFEAWIEANSDHTPLELLEAGRRWIAFGVTLLLWLSIFPLKRLVGRNAAYLAFIFLAVDPFAVALSRQLHPDGFVAGFIFLSLVYYLAWLYAGRLWRDIVLSGIFMGLAWLTKTPAALLVPIGGVLLVAQCWRIWHVRRQILPADPYAGEPESHSAHLTQQRSRTVAIIFRLCSGYLLWGIVAIATFFLLWPAMWADPAGSLLRMGTEMEAYVEGHVNPNFFMGAPTTDPGVFFYPVALFFRITPAVAVGLVAALVFYMRRDWIFAEARTRRTVRALTFFVIAFMVAMTVPAKKFDRYILPAFLALDVIAAVGWIALAQAPWRVDAAGWQRRLRSISPTAALLSVAFILHGFFTLLTYPYYLTYFNPLAGGSRTAPNVLFVGWGEGLDEAARWLNAQPESEDFRIAAWYADGPFSYFTDGVAVPMGYSSPLSWLDTDYAVTYVNQWQRQLPSPEAVAWFETQTPVHEVHKDGLALARVYDLRNTLLPPFIDLNTAPAADFGAAMRLVGIDLPEAKMAPGEQQQVTLYLQALAPMEMNYNVLVRLVAPDGDEIWRSEGWPWGAPTANWPVRQVRPDGHTITVPPDAAPGLYQLLFSFYDPATFAPLSG
ncbi:MAG: glycosyltransferase family 39 protein, partial [Caldilinea sp.]